MYWLTLLTMIVTHVDAEIAGGGSNSAFNSSYARYEYRDMDASQLTELMLGVLFLIIR